MAANLVMKHYNFSFPEPMGEQFGWMAYSEKGENQEYIIKMNGKEIYGRSPKVAEENLKKYFSNQIMGLKKSNPEIIKELNKGLEIVAQELGIQNTENKNGEGKSGKNYNLSKDEFMKEIDDCIENKEKYMPDNIHN
jgi:hypothetical protein